MWGWIKSTASSVWNGVSGGLSWVGRGLGWFFHRILGLGELLISLLGFRPKKKMRLKVLVLRASNRDPLALVGEVQAVVDEAKRAFRHEANIRIVPPNDDESIVLEYPEQNPSYVLTPKCDGGGFRNSFTRVGRWFRGRTRMYSRRGGAVVFVVDNVIGKAGCFLALVDYGYIDGDALRDSAGKPAAGGRKLLLAHELGHACDLRHRDNPANLMNARNARRTSHLTRWQRAVVRSSGRVRYW